MASRSTFGAHREPARDLRSIVDRREFRIILEVAVIVAWLALRTIVGVRSDLYAAWAVTAAILAFVSPVSGLVVLGSTAAFFEPVSAIGVVGWRTVIVVTLAIGVAVRLLAGGWRRYPRSPVAGGAALLALVTLGGVIVTFSRFDEAVAWHAAGSWLATIGGAMFVLLSAVWVFRDGERRPLVAAIAACVVAAVLCLVEYVAPGSISTSPLAWIGSWKDFGNRLSGVIASPNGVATLFVIPGAILVAAALLGSDRRLRLVAAAGAAPLLVALVLTLSRASIIAFLIFGVVFAWRIRRELGIAVVVVGLIGGITLLPAYLQTRSLLAPVEGAVAPGSVLVASDQTRFRAWAASARMFRDDPVFGQGFLSYRQIAPEFGDRILNSPHNEWLRLFAEEGVLGGLAGLALVGLTLAVLRRTSGWWGAGIFAGFLGYVVMASFNNPLLFIQISVVVFMAVGYGLASVAGAARARAGPVTEGG